MKSSLAISLLALINSECNSRKAAKGIEMNPFYTGLIILSTMTISWLVMIVTLIINHFRGKK